MFNYTNPKANDPMHLITRMNDRGISRQEIEEGLLKGQWIPIKGEKNKYRVLYRYYEIIAREDWIRIDRKKIRKLWPETVWY